MSRPHDPTLIMMNTLVTPLELTALNSVPPPKATRKLAGVLALLFLLLPVLLINVPWRQNVSARGTVTALNPLDRVRVIPAPVTGRLVKVEVWEGVRVEKDQVLAEMADQDPEYASRLAQQYALTEEEIRAATALVERYDEQLLHLLEARDQAIASENFKLEMAIEKVNGTRRDVEGLEAELIQKDADLKRKESLFSQGLVSELVFQKAESEALAAGAKLASAKAKVEQAIKDENSKRATVKKVTSDQQAKIEDVRGKREEALSKLANSEKKLTDAATKVERQRLQLIKAPAAGTIQRVHAAQSSDLVSKGSPLIEIVPDTEVLTTELWVRGIDAPLITPGRKVRIQFEGWPAVQISGWPSVAVGTHGGVVSSVDAQGRSDGYFRVLVLPDPDEAPWPKRSNLRQGVRAKGWLLLDTVSLGYEFWRQLNAFPPSLKTQPDPVMGSGEKSSSGKSGADKKE